MEARDADAAEAPQQKAGPFAYGLLLFMGIAWGLALSLAKIAGNHGGHPIGMAHWQVCVSGGMLLALAILTGRPPPLRRAVVGFGFVCGTAGVAFPALAMFWAIAHLPAGVVAIAFAAMPLFTYMLSVLFRVEQTERRRFFGVVIGLAAMALLILPKDALPAPGLAPWVLLALSASVGMAFENVFAGGFRPPDASSLQLSCARQLGAVAVLTPIALSTGTLLPIFEPWGALQWASTGTGVLSGMAYTILLYVIRKAGPVFASQTAYMITLAGVAWGLLLFDERHSIYIWLALALTLFAVSLVKPSAPRAGRILS